MDLFSESLQRLQDLHDQQVRLLASENARLQEELDSLRKAAKAVDQAPERHVGVALHEPLRPLPCQWRTEASHASVAADLSKLSSKSTRQPSKDTSKDPKFLSEEVSRAVCRHLTHLKREKSAVIGMPTVGSSLLDEYSTYRRQESRGLKASGWVSKLVSSPKFDMLSGTVILVNAVTIGLDASLARAGRNSPLALDVLEYVFLSLYAIEICLRLGALGRQAMCNAWVVFDFVLVCCGFFDVVTTVHGHSSFPLHNVVLVRILRLARLARVLRLMVKFHTLFMLVQGLLNSLMTLTWTCIIICILLFVFSVLGLELLQPDPAASDEYNRVARENFGSLLRAGTSLLQGLTLDSFAVIYRPVMLAKPVTIFYFVPFMLIVSIALMNLVTALMVNFSLEQASKDKQAEEQVQSQRKANVVRILERAFFELDTNGSGHVDLQEMLGAPEELRTLICEVAALEDNELNIVEIFRTLDFNHTGYVKIEDFCQGLIMLHDRKALESYFVMKYCSSILSVLLYPQKAGDEKGSAALESMPGDAWEEKDELQQHEGPPWCDPPLRLKS